MTLWMIRHGITPGNASGRYVGRRTDEGLSFEGRRKLKQIRMSGIYPEMAAVCVSPMLRCRETADILFPGAVQYIIDDLQECDFGLFEYKNYSELNGRPDYQAWIDSGGTGGFPGGESLEEFCFRTTKAFVSMTDHIFQEQILCCDQIALVCHGGTIMAVLEAFAKPHREYFEWQAGNGAGYVVSMDMDKWKEGEYILTVQSEVSV